MKKIYVITIGFVISLFAFITCKPDPVDPPPPPVNKPPVAKAGKDTSITLASCGSTGYVMLDGTASFDPDNNYSSLAYSWTFISVQNISNGNIISPKGAQPAISNLKAGQYNIELTVTDPGGLFSKDTVTVDVIGSTAKGYDLDITINGDYRFQNNYEDCYYYYYTPCYFYDLSNIEHATGSFSPIGTINFYAYEQADTATASDGHDTHFGLHTGNNNNVSVYGTSSINLKKVYQSGGGSFNGTFTPTDGSAINCDPNIFKNLAPLTVTGTLNATTNIITLNIKGKIYF
jgi:hypothetical protein